MIVDRNFKTHNFINLTESDLKKNIYRIMPIPFLDIMLSKKTLALAKTSSWDDPYENFFFKQNFVFGNQTVSADEIIKNIYGQCWSLFKDSDALWRIYSQNKDCVRISTTIEKLLNTIEADNFCTANTYIGAVDYRTKQDIDNWSKVQGDISMSNIQRIGVNSLFIKRNNFSHEKEIRIIFQGEANPSYKADTLKIYNINSIDFIDEITFDPRVEDTYYKAYSKYLKKTYSLKCKISKSPMYQFTPNTLTII